MKIPLILTLAVALLTPLAQAASLKVFTSAEPKDLAGRFGDAKDTFTFVSLPAGQFSKPAVVRYATLTVPESIKSERSDHDVGVGVIVSDHGKVVATCIESSNCKALEKAARNFAKALEFRPASLDGTPVFFYVVMPVSYKYADPAELLK